MSIVAPEGTRLVLFGGKGGVGKTTCAAAAAIALARAVGPTGAYCSSPTDPAHSLADALGAAVDDRPAPIRGGPRTCWCARSTRRRRSATIRARYAAAIDALFDRLTRDSGTVGFDAGHDRRVMQALIDLAPPGIDELAAVIEVIDVTEADPAALVVMDTAPSGHALRLLEMPALVQDWTRALMSMVLKYQAVTGVGSFGAILLKLSQGLGRLRALLADPRRAAFVVVTRGARLPRAETVRLIARLKSMDVHVPAVMVNAVGRGVCAACRREASAERREIRELRGALPRACPVLLAPAQLPPPHGSASLRAWQSQWRT